MGPGGRFWCRQELSGGVCLENLGGLLRSEEQVVCGSEDVE